MPALLVSPAKSNACHLRLLGGIRKVSSRQLRSSLAGICLTLPFHSEASQLRLLRKSGKLKGPFGQVSATHSEQELYTSLLQKKHEPQAKSKAATTLSPFLIFETPLPTSSTMPVDWTRAQILGMTRQPDTFFRLLWSALEEYKNECFGDIDHANKLIVGIFFELSYGKFCICCKPHP